VDCVWLTRWSAQCSILLSNSWSFFQLRQIYLSASLWRENDQQTPPFSMMLCCGQYCTCTVLHPSCLSSSLVANRILSESRTSSHNARMLVIVQFLFFPFSRLEVAASRLTVSDARRRWWWWWWWEQWWSHQFWHDNEPQVPTTTRTIMIAILHDTRHSEIGKSWLLNSQTKLMSTSNTTSVTIIAVMLPRQWLLVDVERHYSITIFWPISLAHFVVVPRKVRT